MIYLDNAATTYPKPECVYTTVNKTQRELAVNVGRGSYSIAVDAMRIVDDTRLIIANLLGAEKANDVVFTPSATIASNEIILGFQWDSYKNVYITPFEHNAIARPIEAMRQRYDFKVYQLPFLNETHELDIDSMQRMFIANPPDFVFINHLSNVTGTIIPVDTIANSAKEYGAIIVVDGSQSIGLLDINLQKSAIDYIIFAGHKNLYASFGVGGFINNSSYKLKPFFAGGTGSDSLNLFMNESIPAGFELGSYNIIAIASLYSSIDWLNKTNPLMISHKKKVLMNKLVNGLKQTSATLYLPQDISLHTSVLSFNVPNYTPDEVGTILDRDFNIAVRTGYHCAPYVHGFIGADNKHGTVRVSLSFFNTENDVDALVNAITEL